MRLDLKWLKMHPHESESFAIHENLDSQLSETLHLQCLEPIDLELQVENTGKEYVASGRVQTSVQLSCGRCLKEIAYPIDIPVLFDIVEGTDPSGEAVVFQGEWVDVSPRIAEVIYLALPMVPLCKEDCQGLCSQCGADLNTTTCDCKHDDIDPRWEKLKHLL